MMKRGIPSRRSRAAAWARLAGALTLPVLVLAALGSRFGLVPEFALIPVLILGFGLALLALALAGYALVDVWKAGVEGAGAAIAGILYAVPSVLVLAAVTAAAVFYPPLTDISTDPLEPPILERAVADQENTQGVPDPTLQAASYPEIGPHFYPQPLSEVYGAARRVIEGRGWDIVRDDPPLATPAPPATQAEKPTGEGAEPEAEAAAAQARTDAGSTAAAGPAPSAVAMDSAGLQVVAPTPVFGFPDDVAIELRQDPNGTRVDMRSASRRGRHDLGQNARRIRRLFADLDAALQPDPNAPVPPRPAGDGAGPVARAGELPAPPPEPVQPSGEAAGQ